MKNAFLKDGEKYSHKCEILGWYLGICMLLNTFKIFRLNTFIRECFNLFVILKGTNIPRLWLRSYVAITPILYCLKERLIILHLGHSILADINKLQPNAPTGIEDFYCIHSHGFRTPSKLIYKPGSLLYKAFPEQQPYIVQGDGDKLVNFQSLEVCKNWTGVNYTLLEGESHSGILVSDSFIRILRNATGGAFDNQ